MIKWERNTVRIPPRATTPVRIGTRPSVSPNSIRSQEIESPRRSIVPQEVSNSKPLYTPINGIYSQHRDPTPTWSKVIGSKFSNKSSDDVYPHCRMNLACDTASWIWGCRPSTQPMNLVTSSSPLTELARQHMDPNGSHVAIVLVKLQRIE